jgi:MFS family permease
LLKEGGAMVDITAPELLSALRAKSVQDHIDELPMWADGTLLQSAPMTGMQWLIWSLAAAGKFFAGFVVFMTGVAIPLFSDEFSIGPADRGIIGAASLFGILVGAVALGCDYPTAHMIISENIPSVSRGRLVLGAYAFQAVGALSGTAVGYLVLSALPKIDAWRWMYAAVILPAVLVTIGRLYIVESANWLSARGEIDKAEKAAKKLLVRRPQYPSGIKLAPHHHQPAASSQSNQTYASLFNKVHRRATIFASVPWFLQDLGSYGIGIFTPTILAAAVGANLDHVRSAIDLILNDIAAAKGTALITAFLIVGVIFAILFTDTVGRVALQILGFLGCAAGLLLASLSFNFTGRTETLLMFSGFMLFNFMTSLGPSAQTYLLAGEVFPTAIRGKGAGFAAAIGKIGAVATAFLFPILLDTIGTRNLLYGLIVASILGAAVTWLFRIETRGVSLDAFED